MSYLINKYKGKYRLLVPYDATTNMFSRKLDGTFEDIDVYIACQKNIQIFHYGQSILEAYIPSINRGRNILRDIAADENLKDAIFDIRQNDAEVYFKFHSKYMDALEKYLKPKTSGADISPFSSKNLPKNKTFKIPDEDLIKYKEITQNIPKERILELSHMTNNFIKSLVNRRNTWDNIKLDMAKKMLKGKEYIYSIGKWNDYIAFLKKNIK